MHSRYSKIIPWVLWVVCVPFSFSAAQDRHVVVISIDGFPAWLWRDPSLPIPNLRQLAADGAAATSMVITNPSSTWSNHTTMITGQSPRKHGVLFNGLLRRPGGGQKPFVEQWADKNEYVRVPALYDIARANGLTSAESDWVAVKGAKTIDWSFAEAPEAGDPVVQAMLNAGQLKAEEFKWMEFGPKREVIVCDGLWTRAAAFMFKQYHPNLLLYHSLNTDHINHTYGPGTSASLTALAYADRLVGDLVKAVEESGLRDQTTFIVVTDHGFKKVSRYLYPNVVLKKAGYVQVAGARVVKQDAYTMPWGGTAGVYVDDPARRAELKPKLKALFEQTEGIARVIDGNDGPSLGLPLPEENNNMPDLILVAKDEGFAFNELAVGEAAIGPTTNYGGTHGFLASDPDLEGIFIASGAGIKPGASPGRIRNLDVAPTIARLLGLPLPNAEGRVLEEILALKP
jgi:predicted AlkP superfamily pyrophosphatase or phosphodiesterase